MFKEIALLTNYPSLPDIHLHPNSVNQHWLDLILSIHILLDVVLQRCATELIDSIHIFRHSN